MAQKYMQLVLTPAVQRAQDHYFGGHDVVDEAPETDPFTDHEADFIAARDSFYMATVSETGWPYLQHRGGPAGFVKILGPNFLGFADFQGNQQLLSTGNLAANDRVAIFMMDYPRRARGQAGGRLASSASSSAMRAWSGVMSFSTSGWVKRGVMYFGQFQS